MWRNAMHRFSAVGGVRVRHGFCTRSGVAIVGSAARRRRPHR